VLAARLAEGGRRVVVLEAGGDPLAQAGNDAAPSKRRLRDDVNVPAFHPFASEHPGLKDDYWVRHYADDAQQARDWRYSPAEDGVLYPRARGLGGCASHHAMIIVQPNNADWNHIRRVTGDDSWRASNMQRYFQRIEDCRYRAPWRRWFARLLGWNPTGHGWNGWLRTERAFPLRVLRDWTLKRTLLRATLAAADAQADPGAQWHWSLTSLFDPNDRRLVNERAWGVRLAPMATKRHVRHGPRERLLAVAARHPDRLEIRTHATALGVVVDRATMRATGVRYRDAAGAEHVAEARREVVLAGGAFASPQLLMLSGIGDPEHLAEHGIDVVRPLRGVGRNLQDRYEVGVVSRMKRPWEALDGVTYSRRDTHYRRWRWLRAGNYTSNGVMVAAVAKSRAQLPVADLFCFSLLADFRGYHPGYAERIRDRDKLTWAVLKAYTDNTAGTVRLRGVDATLRPAINFRYFDEGNAATRADLDAVVAGIRFVRRAADGVADLVAAEEEPGRHLRTDEQLRGYVRDNAWGHHACGTCAMKPEAEGGVVDSRFRVHGVAGLRVVDASVFPKIPGYFLVAAVFMIAEKAADVMLADADGT
jgi:choline dehydrogenase